MDETGDLPLESQFNEKLASQIFNLGALENYLRFVYGSLEGASRSAGLTAGRVRQICLGISLPSTPEVVNKLARSWGIDPAVLMKIFSEANK